MKQDGTRAEEAKSVLVLILDGRGKLMWKPSQKK